MRFRHMIGAGALLGALVVAGCGAPTGGTGSARTTVAARSVAGFGTALVNADGQTLYFTDQEAGGNILCVGACGQFWVPLTVAAGSMPTAGSGVGGTLSTVNRADGTAQVTYDGHPLYTFVKDGGPGQTHGNGVTDSFDGTTFVWHAGTASGTPAPGDGGNPGFGY